MKYKIFFLLFLLTFLNAGSLFAEGESPSPYWDASLDVGYRFTILPGEDLAAILDGEGAKYGQTLSDYIATWEEILSKEGKGINTGLGGGRSLSTHNPDAVYRRIAVGNLLLYLRNNNEKFLDAAMKHVEHIAKRRITPRTIFWNNLILAHKRLTEGDALGFSHHVFRIWIDVIQVLEKGQIMAGSKLGTTGFMNSLPYLYENTLHLVLYHGITRHKLPNLHSLGSIIWSLQDRLEPGKGYYQLAASIWNRMYGATSDNFNISFAMAILEGEIRWIDFEGSPSSAGAAKAFKESRAYYELALEWADTKKGKAAALTRLMQSMIKTLNRMAQRSDIMSDPIFEKVPADAAQFVTSAKNLYVELSSASFIDGGGRSGGFEKKEYYIMAMHDLWTNIAQVDIMLTQYYRQVTTKTNEPAKNLAYFEKLSEPLFDYLSFFDKFTKNGHKSIIPDNAYFYAAYIASEIADLHLMRAPYSNDMEEYDLAFARQLQAIEVFPFDVMAILSLGMETSQEGTLATYMENVWPIADRLEKSKVIREWVTYKNSPYINEIRSLQNIIPEALKSAPSMIGLAGNDKRGKELIDDTLLLTQVQKSILQSDFSGKADAVLADIARDLREGHNIISSVEKNLPIDVVSQIVDAMNHINMCRYSEFKKTLFRDPYNIHHSLLRGIYHEVPNDNKRYVKLLNTVTKRREKRIQSGGTFKYRSRAKDEE